MSGPEPAVQSPVFAGSRDRFESLLDFLSGDQAGSLTHHELECRLQVDGRELLRGLFQDHLDLRASREARIEGVADAKGASYAIASQDLPRLRNCYAA